MIEMKNEKILTVNQVPTPRLLLRLSLPTRGEYILVRSTISSLKSTVGKLKRSKRQGVNA
jgi:hypothetical protein